ncbi:MAG: pseudaminic acid synthase [Nitrospinae bacterium]|jgi:N-acetylneuraminate synthase|nr:pseudaminic acid synthase [Nitrospinota bacterium]HJN01665.1 pseudaminic acid synthase [Nitrospinota bacterium]|tara:strand:+ start:1408 stop:2502 length:1095 start_codon:yes stop_codon:yes gene_type:complete
MKNKVPQKSPGIEIDNHIIGKNHTPFIVAEMSGNHNQSLDRALEIVEAVAQSGAHALKLQTYTADTITLDLKEGEFFINDPNSLWEGQSLHSLYKKAYTPWEWHEKIIKKCRGLGLTVFSTPFDETSVDFLESLDVPAYKIASFENVHLPLLRKVASTGKPVIMSTGMATLSELDEAVSEIRKTGNSKVILLKCTSSYPASPENANILTIPHLRELFGCDVGISDHVMGIGVAIAAVAVGAVMVEKHFTLKRDDGGIDSAFSIEPKELKMLVTESHKAWQSLGCIKYGPTDAEKESARYRRSIYVSQDINKGDLLTEKNLRIVRPGFGILPKYYDMFLGKKASVDVKKGTPVNWSLILGKEAGA